MKLIHNWLTKIPGNSNFASNFFKVSLSFISKSTNIQDEVGAYTYGYNSAEQTKSEVKTADGVVRGSYSYIDANGIVQTVNYISDAMGFRVAATNLPVHHVEGGAAAAPVVAAKYEGSSVLTPAVNYAHLPYAQGYDYTMPQASPAA